MAREETAIHVHARWGIPVSQSVEVALFGGPTFFSVSQAFVTGIDFDQAYPYDTATLTGAMTRTEDGSTIGFNVGADVSVYFSRWLGVGGLIRFSRSEVDFGDRPTTIAVGGLHTAAGLRLRFLTPQSHFQFSGVELVELREVSRRAGAPKLLYGWTSVPRAYRDLAARAGIPRVLDALLNPGQTCANKAASVL